MIQITKASPLAARSRVLGALFAGALIGSSVAGQSVFIPSDTPTLGVCNITPFGDLRTSTRWVNQKYQCLATGPQLGNRARGTITDLGFAACSTGVGSIYFDSIEVVLAQTRSVW